MSKLIFLALFLFSTSFCFSQIKAVTETGEQVLLFDDGTWKYADSAKSEEPAISLNPKAFTKSEGANFLLKSTKADFGIWLDSKKWQFRKAENNESAEYEFHHKTKDLYGMIIIEKIQIPLETLINIALQNAQKAAPDAKIAKQEYRTVNNKKMLCLQINGTLQGVKFSYFGYYYSNDNGTVQFVTYTSPDLLKSYLNDAEELLNGLVEINNTTK